jgi:uncharacterized membrane protein YfcA
MASSLFGFVPASDVIVFLLGTFVGAIVLGTSGFAFALVAAAVWEQSLTPSQATALIVPYALIIQVQAVWRMRRTIVMCRVWPFIVGSALGIPLGVLILHKLTVGQLRLGIAVLLILFSLYSLVRSNISRLTCSGGNRSADVAIGVVNGLLGGATGFAGVAIVIWTGLRGWSTDEQRAVFQPATVATYLMCLPTFVVSGMFTAQTLHLFFIGLPCLLIGNVIGWTLYGRLNEAAFRQIVLLLLFASGIALLVAGR